MLPDEETHRVLASSYDQLVNERPSGFKVTRTAARGEPQSTYAKTPTYYNSFLPKTVRELKLQKLAIIVTNNNTLYKC